MKIRTIALASLALIAGAASAQSSVTIYGRLNVTMERENNAGDKVWKQNDNSSRIGFKGVEDLGGGTQAGFILESGMDVSNGKAGSSFWGRQSEVFLAGKAGTVRLGNFTSEAYYATADWVSMHNHDTGRSADALYADAAGWAQINKVAYRAPTFVKDLSLEASYGVKESAPDAAYDFAANYALGDLALGLGWGKVGDKHQTAVRAAYTIGPVVLGTYVQRDKNVLAAGSRTNVRLSGMYTLGASEFHLNFGRAGKYDGVVADSKATQATLAYNYNLSKRTKVYTYFTKINDSAAAIYGGDTSSLALGVRHNF
jgi:predicted porin